MYYYQSKLLIKLLLPIPVVKATKCILYTLQDTVLRGIKCRPAWRSGTSTHLWTVHG